MSVLLDVYHGHNDQIGCGVLYVHHNRNLHTCHEPLHAAQKARVFHVWLRWLRKTAQTQDLEHHRIVDVSLAHARSGMRGVDHMCGVFCRLPDVSLQLTIGWRTQDLDLLF